MQKRLSLFALLGVALLGAIYFVFIQPQKPEVLFPEWLGKEVLFPEELQQLKDRVPVEIDDFLATNEGKNKIISIIDASCAKCIMGQLNKIDSVFSDLVYKDDNTTMVFVVNFYEQDFDNFMLTLYPMIKANAVILWDKDYYFETQNDIFTPKLKARTFLLNPKNEIVLVGNPLFGDRILSEYEKLVKNGQANSLSQR